MTHKHRKKLINFIFLSSLSRAEGFSRSLHISNFFDQKKIKQIFCCIFFCFSLWSSKPWIRIGFENSLEMLDPDPYSDPNSLNPDPQLWSQPLALSIIRYHLL
jgi:hypothetical protein